MIFMGDIPPPVHGMAAINKALLECSQARGLVYFINTAPSALASCFNSRFWLLIKAAFFFPVTVQLLWGLFRRRDRVFYRSLNGGTGQFFDVCWLWLARLAGAQIFLHHHASSYLLVPTSLFKLVQKAAGANAQHIVLGKAMHQALMLNYNVPTEKIRIISNSAFFSMDETASTAQKPTLHIGYLANLSTAKGLDIFLAVVHQLHRRQIPFIATIAGPCADTTLSKTLKQSLEDIPALTWTGPVYGEAKRAFLAPLDVFVYPSRNEAEPLVLYEAAQQGALLVGSQSGCMQDVIARLGGFSYHLQEPDEWVNWAVGIIDAADVTAAAKSARKAAFHAAISESKHDLNNLLNDFFHAAAR